jgi:hypothetical protein
VVGSGGLEPPTRPLWAKLLSRAVQTNQTLNQVDEVGSRLRQRARPKRRQFRRCGCIHLVVMRASRTVPPDQRAEAIRHSPEREPPCARGVGHSAGGPCGSSERARGLLTLHLALRSPRPGSRRAVAHRQFHQVVKVPPNLSILELMSSLFRLWPGPVEQWRSRSHAWWSDSRRSRSIGDRTHEAARVLRRRAMAPGRPRTFMIRPVVL